MTATLLKAEVAVEPPRPVAATVCAWRAPAVDQQSSPPGAEPPDPAAFLARLASGLAALTGFAWTFGTSDERPPPTAVFARSDGLVVAAGAPDALAAALVGQRCGGGFDPAGADVGAPSVVRARAEFEAAILRAADGAWPGTGAWSPLAASGRVADFAVAAQASGTAFVLSFAVVPAVPSTVAPSDDAAAWTSRLRRTLDATPFALRAVLHERTLRLAEALALRVGDVLPIDTRRDVSLRLGDRALARGTIAADHDGGHRITVVGHARAGMAPAGGVAVTSFEEPV